MIFRHLLNKSRSSSVLFYFIIVKCFSQLSDRPHGTLLVALICNDGIILSADSRASWQDNNKILYAYTDGVRKLFPIGKYQIAISGESCIEGVFWKDIIKSYSKKNKADSSLKITLDNFLTYLNSEFPKSKLSIKHCTFILAGYQNKIPVIVGADSTGIADTTPVLTSSPVLNPFWNIPNPNPYDCINSSILLENIYKKCSSVDLSVGGPLHIIKISPSNMTKEIKSFKFLNYKNDKQFVSSILKGKQKITYVYPQSEKALRDVLVRRLELLNTK